MRVFEALSLKSLQVTVALTEQPHRCYVQKAHASFCFAARRVAKFVSFEIGGHVIHGSRVGVVVVLVLVLAHPKPQALDLIVVVVLHAWGAFGFGLRALIQETCRFGCTNLKVPCAHVVYTLVPKYLYRDYLTATGYAIWVHGPPRLAVLTFSSYRSTHFCLVDDTLLPRRSPMKAERENFS